MDLLRIRVMVRQSISKRFAVWDRLRFTGTALSVILSESGKGFRRSRFSVLHNE